jgi:outer membrane protein OmpA-like peptidoglycan-associated protein
MTEATARAQSGFAVDRFEPAGGGSAWFSLDSLDLRGHLRPAAGLSTDLALRPVVIYDREGHEVAPLVRYQAMLHADVALVLWERVRLGVNVPLALAQDGQSGMVGGVSYVAPTGEVLGDVRLGVDVRLFGEPTDGVTAAIGGRVFLPTGHQSAYTSDGGPRLWPHLALAGEAGPFVWAARVGFHVRPTYKCTCALTPGNEVTGALAVGFRILPTLLIGPELYGSSPVSGDNFLKPVASPVEVLLGAHFALARDWTMGLGAAPGLTDGAGSPAWRFVAALQFFPAIAAPPATRRPSERAAPEAEPVAKRVPPPRPAPAAGPQPALPPKAAKPAAPAPPPPAPPPPPPPPPPTDRDGDTIVDPEDGCPDTAGPPNVDPTRNGCPVAHIEGGQIRIREQVKFKTNSAVILKESNYILVSLVKILTEHPEIKKMRVEGHTDAQGKAKANKKLSQKRAASVVKWLTKYGINKSRLSSEGWGQERPLATNNTDEGRRENRRVEFHIVEGPGGEGGAK